MRRIALGFLTGSVLLATQASAQGSALFRDSDYKLGERLIAEHQCAACHQKRVGGDGSAIYKPTGKINTPGFLRGMVEQCNTELNLGMFPEEVTSVAGSQQRPLSIQVDADQYPYALGAQGNAQEFLPNI
jgi:cytochrome c peroxidase